jgi:hypothetical protein
VFGLNAGQDPAEDLEVFLNAFQVTFPILLDAGSTKNIYRQSGAISPYPLDYVIDQQGRVAYFSTEYHPEEMIAVIEGLLAVPTGQPDTPAMENIRLRAAPNPFNPTTQISFILNKEQPVSLNIMDQRGHLVRTLVASEIFASGENTVPWDGRDSQGRSLSSGLYIARIQTLDGSAVAKLTLVQ